MLQHREQQFCLQFYNDVNLVFGSEGVTYSEDFQEESVEEDILCLRWSRYQGSGEKCIMPNVIIFTPHQILG